MTSLPVSGSGGSSIPTGRRTSAGRRASPRPASHPAARSCSSTRSLHPTDATEIWARLDASPPTVVVILKPDHVRDVDVFVRALRRARIRPLPRVARQHSGDGARGDRAWRRAARRPRRPLRRAWPQRDAGLAARAARPRLRRCADGTGRELLVWGTPWHEERTLPALRALLELPFEHVIVSHGEPVHDRAAYERALELPPWSD